MNQPEKPPRAVGRRTPEELANLLRVSNRGDRVCARTGQKINIHQEAWEIDLGGDVGVVVLSPVGWMRLQYIIREWLKLPVTDELIFNPETGIPEIHSGVLSGVATGRGAAIPTTPRMPDEEGEVRPGVPRKIL